MMAGPGTRASGYRVLFVAGMLPDGGAGAPDGYRNPKRAGPDAGRVGTGARGAAAGCGAATARSPRPPEDGVG